MDVLGLILAGADVWRVDAGWIYTREGGYGSGFGPLFYNTLIEDDEESCGRGSAGGGGDLSFVYDDVPNAAGVFVCTPQAIGCGRGAEIYIGRVGVGAGAGHGLGAGGVGGGSSYVRGAGAGVCRWGMNTQHGKAENMEREALMELWDRGTAAEMAKMSEDCVYAQRYREADEGRRKVIADGIFALRRGIASPRLPPAPTVEVAGKLARGNTPQELYPMLTKREAAAFCEQDVTDDPTAWLWATTLKSYDIEVDEGAAQPRSLKVARWAQERLRKPAQRAAMLRERRGHLEGIEGTVIARIDEFEEADLRPSINATLAATAERSMRKVWSGPDELIKVPWWARQLPEGVTLITRASGLILEGASMRHCAAMYCERVASGELLFFSIICGEGERSTLVLHPNGTVDQHVGFGNSAPPKACVARAHDILLGERSAARNRGERLTGRDRGVR